MIGQNTVLLYGVNPDYVNYGHSWGQRSIWRGQINDRTGGARCWRMHAGFVGNADAKASSATAFGNA
jgi:hypothetical protein